jgi:hypothetical protein
MKVRLQSLIANGDRQEAVFYHADARRWNASSLLVS